MRDILSKNKCAYLVRGLEEGRPAWFYVLIDKLKLPILERLQTDNTNTINLSQYGDIIEQGWGKQPPEYIQKRIKEKYG